MCVDMWCHMPVRDTKQQKHKKTWYMMSSMGESNFCFVMYFWGSTCDKYCTCLWCISTNNSNLSGVLGITKKSLNRLTGHRLVPIQEPVHQIAGLNLIICSDNLYSFSLGKANALVKNWEQAAPNKKCLANSTEIDLVTKKPFHWKHTSTRNLVTCQRQEWS